MTRQAAPFLVAGLLLAGCGGGGSSTPAVRTSALVAGKLVLTISQPPASAARKPQYISQSAVSVSIAVNGGAPQIADISGTSPNCMATELGRICTVPLQAPVGNDTFAIAQYDGANATGHLLGSGTAMTTVVAGQPFVVQAVLNGVAASFQLNLGPIPPSGVPGATTLSVVALDPAGSTIIGPGNYTVPITLTVTDPTHQTTLSSSTITAPSLTPITVTYAGGLGVSATITASASGATPASVVFAPAVGTFYYVANSNANTLTAYPLNANGNAAPARTVSGGLTTLNLMTSITSDTSGDLYVANAATSVAVFAPRPNGNVAPIRTLAGPNTGILGAADLALDPQGDLYVANCGSCMGFGGAEAVLVFAPGASGNVAPIREITGPQTGLFGTTAVGVDGAGNIFVASAFGNSPSILVFPATATGNVASSGSISGGNTGLNNPLCLILDIANELYVCNQNNTITVYAAGARGNVAPVRTIGGANTGLSLPDQIGIDAAGNIYVANVVNNSVTVYPPNANGNQTPLFTLVGPNTGLNGAGSITLAP
jgi:sugar lactone lactonase YvrE